jgi:hypothetical protein
MTFELRLEMKKRKSFTLCQHLVRYSSECINVLDFFHNAVSFMEYLYESIRYIKKMYPTYKEDLK